MTSISFQLFYRLFLLVMSGLDLMECDEWCKATSVTSKSAVTTFGFEVDNFENVIKSGSAVHSSSFKIGDTNWIWSIGIFVDGDEDESDGDEDENDGDYENGRKGSVAIFLWNDNDVTYTVEGKMTSCGVIFEFLG